MTRNGKKKTEEIIKEDCELRSYCLGNDKSSPSSKVVFGMRQKKEVELGQEDLSLRGDGFYRKQYWGAQAELPKMVTDSEGEALKTSIRNLVSSVEEKGVSRKDVKNIFRKCYKNFYEARGVSRAFGSASSMEGSKSRKVSKMYSSYEDGASSTTALEYFEGGNANSSFFDRFCKTCMDESIGRLSQERGFFGQKERDRLGNRWAMAFSECGGIINGKHSEERQGNGGIRYCEWMDRREGMRRRHLFGSECFSETRKGAFFGNDASKKFSEVHHSLFRRVVRATFVGRQKAYDLEVAHPSHNFVLASGLVTSNSHAVAYAYLSFQCMFLKTYYPFEYLSAAMTHHPYSKDNAKKLKLYRQECKRQGITVLRVDINQSKYHYTFDKEKNIIRAGMNSAPNVGKAAFVIQRFQPFTSFTDFFKRVPKNLVRINAIKSLLNVGAFNGLGENKDEILKWLDAPAVKKPKEKKGEEAPVEEQEFLL